MWRRILASGVAVAVTALGWAPPALALDGIRTPRNPSYKVTLSSDASGTLWTGHASVSFTNLSVDPLGDVNLRLWGNARGRCPAAATAASAMPVTVSHVTGGTAGPLTVRCTSLRIILAKRLRRGQSASIGYDLQIRVPAGAGRFGREGPYNFLGNALPVLAVRDGAGWHREPYTHVGQPFYTVSGDFTVTLDHPASLLVPATGTAVDAPGSAGRTVTTVTAANVRDFAWAAGPFSLLRGISATGVTVNVYGTSAATAKRAGSMSAVAGSAMAANVQFGAYPYGEIDVVLDNRFPVTGGHPGVAYPGIVFSRADTGSLVQAVARQWWYGIVGDDEYDSPWLDEAFAAYATDLYFKRTGAGCWRKVAWASRVEKVTNSMAYWDAHPSRYATVVSAYGSCALHDLRRKLGSDKMRNLLRVYAGAHWYKVTTTAEFKAHAQSVSPAYLSAFWRAHRIPG
ncbi:M1 family metallopeptidase [Planotetraspora sp. GP83]|uniref:M1 family metallopeptidase n=1 Tax=Planotetraspora sp. GP83 TaxID=3156264 RepID=UPI003514907B